MENINKFYEFKNTKYIRNPSKPLQFIHNGIPNLVYDEKDIALEESRVISLSCSLIENTKITNDTLETEKRIVNINTENFSKFGEYIEFENDRYKEISNEIKNKIFHVNEPAIELVSIEYISIVKSRYFKYEKDYFFDIKVKFMENPAGEQALKDFIEESKINFKNYVFPLNLRFNFDLHFTSEFDSLSNKEDKLMVLDLMKLNRKYSIQ